MLLNQNTNFALPPSENRWIGFSPEKRRGLLFLGRNPPATHGNSWLGTIKLYSDTQVYWHEASPVAREHTLPNTSPLPPNNPPPILLTHPLELSEKGDARWPARASALFCDRTYCMLSTGLQVGHVPHRSGVFTGGFRVAVAVWWRRNRLLYDVIQKQANWGNYMYSMYIVLEWSDFENLIFSRSLSTTRWSRSRVIGCGMGGGEGVTHS